MAAAVGALHVDLGLNSAQFHTGIAKAQGALSGFAKHASTIGNVIGLTIAAIPAAFGAGIKKAIDAADDMGKAAQKVGLTTEELSKLKYAADLSGVSFEGLQGGLIKLSRSMAEAATSGTGPAAEAFKQLGVSVKNNDGTMKTSSQVFSELADKFAGYKDGVNKTALSVAIFGKTGAEMIPMLNMSAAGLKQAATEAERFGLVITGNTAKSAEGFNDNLTRLSSVMRGVLVQAMATVAPHLENLSNYLVDAAKNSNLLQNTGAGLASFFAGVVNAALSAARVIRELAAVFGGLAAAASAAGSGDWEGVKGALAGISKEYENIKKGHEAAVAAMARKPLGGLGIGIRAGRPAPEKPDAPSPKGLQNTGNAGKAAAEKLTEAEKEISSAYQKLKSEAQSLYESTRTPMEAYIDQMAKLKEMMNPTTVDGKSNPLISQATYARAAEAAQEKLNRAIIAGSEVAGIMQSNFNSMFDSFLSGSFNAQEAIKKLLQDILKMMMNKAIMQILGAAFGEGGIGGGSLSWLGIGKNANGTNNWRGGLSLVGERGPELVNMPRGSQVIPNRALQGKASAPVVNVINNNGSQVQTETRNGPNGPELFVILDGWFADRMQKNAGPAKVMQNMFGLRRGAGKAR